jgi:hypothetical protein
MLKRFFRDQRGIEGWIALILGLSILLLVVDMSFDFRNELNKKNLYNEIILSCKELFQEEGGLTPIVESELLYRLESAGFSVENIEIVGSPRNNYGAKITYTVTLNSVMKVGNESVEKEYHKKVVGTSAYIPEG